LIPLSRPTQFEVKKSNKPHQGKFWRVVGYVDGERKPHWYSTEKEAISACREFNVQQQAHGSGLILSTIQRADATTALEILEPYKVTLIDAARHFATYLKSQRSSKPMDVFLAEYEAD
jgi:hypothetical protein